MADKQLYANNAKTTLNGGITAIATSIVVTDGSVFASPAAGEYTLATLYDANEANIEIVKVTNIVTNTLTVVRAQEGTTGYAFSSGDNITTRVTENTLERFLQIDDGGNARGANAINIQTQRDVATDVASGAGSIAIGHGSNSALDAGSIAIGEDADATLDDSIAIGRVTQSTASSSIAIGYSADATAAPSVALGENAQATAISTVAIGEAANASTTNSIAIGDTAAASGLSDSIAVGNGTTTTGRYGISVGVSCTTAGDSGVSIGNTTSAAGASAIAVGISASASQTDAIALGNAATATASDGIAIGGSSAASGADSVSIGSSSDATIGNSVAVGSLAQAVASGAVAIGKSADSAGTNTVSLGISSGNASDYCGALVTGKEISISGRATPYNISIGKTDYSAAGYTTSIAGPDYLPLENGTYVGGAGAASHHLMQATERTFFSPPVQAGVKVWATATAYDHNEVVTPTTAPTGYCYYARLADPYGGTKTSHATTEPTWPTTNGGTVVDNTDITWVCVDLNNIAFYLPDYIRFIPTEVGFIGDADTASVTKPTSVGMNLM